MKREDETRKIKRQRSGEIEQRRRETRPSSVQKEESSRQWSPNNILWGHARVWRATSDKLPKQNSKGINISILRIGQQRKGFVGQVGITRSFQNIENEKREEHIHITAKTMTREKETVMGHGEIVKGAKRRERKRSKAKESREKSEVEEKRDNKQTKRNR